MNMPFFPESAVSLSQINSTEKGINLSEVIAGNPLPSLALMGLAVGMCYGGKKIVWDNIFRTKWKFEKNIHIVEGNHTNIYQVQKKLHKKTKKFLGYRYAQFKRTDDIFGLEILRVSDWLETDEYPFI